MTMQDNAVAEAAASLQAVECAVHRLISGPSHIVTTRIIEAAGVRCSGNSTVRLHTEISLHRYLHMTEVASERILGSKTGVILGIRTSSRTPNKFTKI